MFGNYVKRKNIASLHKVIENVTDALDIIQSSYQDSQNFIQDFDPIGVQF